MNKKVVFITTLLLSSVVLPASAQDLATDTVKSFEQVFGANKGKRRNHTKGFCFTGRLSPKDKMISQYSMSSLFKHDSEVIGRLSHKGGNAKAFDDKHADYGMGLSISTESGEKHLMSMNTLDFFPVQTPKAFAELMRAKANGSEAVAAFKKNSADLRRYGVHHAKKSKILTPYEGTTFNSINSFYLINENNQKTAVRWSFVPQNQQSLVVPQKHDFFYQNMQENLKAHPIVWDMVVTIANEIDDVNNAARAWEGSHTQIVAAELTVSSVATEENGKCEKINFDPLVLSKGFEPSNDPLLQARRNAYAVSFGKRISEQ